MRRATVEQAMSSAHGSGLLVLTNQGRLFHDPQRFLLFLHSHLHGFLFHNVLGLVAMARVDSDNASRQRHRIHTVCEHCRLLGHEAAFGNCGGEGYAVAKHVVSVSSWSRW
jgi:hypothetical protein